jgi:hypothetical protein
MLFGHQNDDNNQSTDDVHSVGINPLAVDPETGVSLPVAPEDLEHDGNDTESAPILDQPHDDVQAPDPVIPTMPTDDFGAVTSDDSATSTPAVVADDKPSTPTPPTADDLLQQSADDDLLSLKQQALEQLSPLVSHLDQSPEEKFRTTMMMIQASDNQGLIQTAYEAAQAIPDEKVKAQALLDIVNEINYFTQSKN